MSLTTKQRDHITKLIMSEVSYFNGWSVSQEDMAQDCWKAACKIEQYLKGISYREKRVNGASLSISDMYDGSES